jgi:hypothetical protein
MHNKNLAILITLSIFIVLYSCKRSNNDELQTKLMSPSMLNELSNKLTYPFSYSDTTNDIHCFIIKYYDESNLVFPLPYHICNQSISKENVKLSICSFSQMSPFYATSVKINANPKNYSLELESHGDVINTSMKFDSLQLNRKAGTLYLSNPISDTVNPIRGFFNIDYYKDKEHKNKDFRICFIFQLLPSRR